MKQNLKHSANPFAAAVAVASVALASVCAVAQDQQQEGAAPAQAASNERLVEARAARMVKSAIALFASNEEDRAVGMLEAVTRMYPDSQTRFSAALEAFIPACQYEDTLLAQAVLEDGEGNVLARLDAPCKPSGGYAGVIEAALPDHPCVLELTTRLLLGNDVIEESALPIYVGERGQLEAAFR